MGIFLILTGTMQQIFHFVPSDKVYNKEIRVNKIGVDVLNTSTENKLFGLSIISHDLWSGRIALTLDK